MGYLVCGCLHVSCAATTTSETESTDAYLESDNSDADTDAGTGTDSYTGTGSVQNGSFSSDSNSQTDAVTDSETETDAVIDPYAVDTFDVDGLEKVSQTQFFEIICNKIAECDPEGYAAILAHPYAKGECYIELHDELGPDFCFGFKENKALDCLKVARLYQLDNYTCLDEHPKNVRWPVECYQSTICETWENDT
jgi:hypothetical protein